MSEPDLPARWTDYFALARERPELFVQPGAGGVKILMDLADMRAVEEDMARSLSARGLPADAGTVGIVAHDPYVYFVRDAVEFPDGSRRTYARVIYRSPGGAVVVPVLDGRIVLIRQFRHAPRRWMLEVPRGGIEPGHTPEEAARAEIREEIGGEIAELIPVGQLYALTNLQANCGYVFVARLKSIGQPQHADAISGIELVTPQEFEAKVVAGDILCTITITAFTQARLRGLV